MTGALSYPKKRDAIDCFGAVLERVTFEDFLELLLGLLELL
jgi:Mg2+/Co2+ transporter CorC